MQMRCTNAANANFDLPFKIPKEPGRQRMRCHAVPSAECQTLGAAWCVTREGGAASAGRWSVSWAELSRREFERREQDSALESKYHQQAEEKHEITEDEHGRVLQR